MDSIVKETLEAIKTECGPDFIKYWEVQPHQYGVEIKSSGIAHVPSYLFTQQKARLVTINASRIQFNKIELMYIFSLEKILKNFIVILRTWIPANNSSIKSITPLIPAANFFEREICEMVGVEFIGHPTPYRLILPYEWPKVS
ncbi:MAG: NADH-quinone oxidoreductase subunit C [Promethearchaeota archaeon]